MCTNNTLASSRSYELVPVTKYSALGGLCPQFCKCPSRIERFDVEPAKDLSIKRRLGGYDASIVYEGGGLS